jgi:hypothetical protein
MGLYFHSEHYAVRFHLSFGPRQVILNCPHFTRDVIRWQTRLGRWVHGFEDLSAGGWALRSVSTMRCLIKNRVVAQLS